MTREQAIEARIGIYTGSEGWKREAASRDVDSLVKLGILKLDEPKNTVAQRLAELGREYPGARGIGWWVQSIEDAGLKIVEKQP